ncbi:MAG: heme-binding domain-containing protein [Gemmatimonadaceae bacterium]|nr:heme-binding domain-containing protein [Gemmatimonadaceae bacterium]
MRPSRLVFGLAAAFAAAQLVPIARENPPVQDEMPAPPAVREILRRACYDCHSNETSWPWYSRVAPVSWWVLDHVKEGRGEFNASEWNRMSDARKLRLPRRLWREVSGGEMPPWYYTPMHPAAKLTAGDTAVLHAWYQAQPPAPEPTPPGR